MSEQKHYVRIVLTLNFADTKKSKHNRNNPNDMNENMVNYGAK